MTETSVTVHGNVCVVKTPCHFQATIKRTMLAHHRPSPLALATKPTSAQLVAAECMQCLSLVAMFHNLLLLPYIASMLYSEQKHTPWLSACTRQGPRHGGSWWLPAPAAELQKTAHQPSEPESRAALTFCTCSYLPGG